MSRDLFQDEVIRATDLNRSSGDILDRAARAPLTIIRNSETFALMRRELATEWRREAACAIHVAEIVWIALSNLTEPAPEHRWINAFDSAQKTEMASELMDAYRKAVRKENWEEFDAVLHEWSESGWAALSPEHRDAFHAESAEVQIEPPATV